MLGEGVEKEKILPRIPSVTSEIIVFPLTSNHLKLEDLRKTLEKTTKASVSIADSGRMVDIEVRKLGKELSPWLARLAETTVGSNSVKEELVLPGMNLSAWWLGVAAERSPLKTSVFLKLSQHKAISRLIQLSHFSHCICTVEDPALAKSIGLALGAVSFDYVPAHPALPMVGRIKNWLRSLGKSGQAVMAFTAWLRLCGKVIKAKQILGSPTRSAAHQRRLLFVTYFPAFENEAAKNGIFRNKYGTHLQDLLEKLDMPVVWLSIYSHLYQTPYIKAVEQVKNFTDHGEEMFLLEQFLGIGDCLKIMHLYFQASQKSAFIYRHALTELITDSPFSKDTAPLLEKLWLESFSGSEPIHTLSYAVALQNAITKLSNTINKCLYYCEMQAWEKALCAATSQHAHIETIAFQHASLPINFWSYFPTPSEVARTGQPSDLPLPDIMATGGDVPYKLLAESNYARLTKVESVRYIYLNEVAKQGFTKSETPALLVAGSIDRDESISILSLVMNAGELPANFRVLLKGHPSMPFGPLMREVGILEIPKGFEIWDDDLAGALETAWVALVSASTVAMEAIAYGCKVVTPLLPNAIELNPVTGFDEWCTTISTPQELKMIIERINLETVPHPRDQGIAFVRRYWNLDCELPAWATLLSSPGNPPSAKHEPT